MNRSNENAQLFKKDMVLFDNMYGLVNRYVVIHGEYYKKCHSCPYAIELRVT